MLFTFPCTCGKFILVEEGAARHFFCPDCGRIHDMPERAIPGRPGGVTSANQNASTPVQARLLGEAPVLPDPDSVGLEPAYETIGPDVADKPVEDFPPAREAPALAREAHYELAETPHIKPATPPAPPPAVIPSAAIEPLPSSPAPLPEALPVGLAVPVQANQAKPPPLPRARESSAEVEEVRLMRRGGRQHAWGRLILGLGFYYGQFLCNLVTLSILMLGLNIMSLIEERAQPRIAGFLIGITALGFFLVGPTLGIVGSWLCFLTPEKVANKNLMIGALALSASPMLFGMIFAIFFAMGGAVVPAVVASMFGLMTMYGAWICFMYFVKQIADYLEMEICVDEAAHFVLLSIPLMVAPVCLLVLGILLADVTMGPVIVMLLITVWLVFNSKFMLGVLNLVSSVRQAIRTRERV